MPNLTKYASFLVRIWKITNLEPSNPQDEWHGELECIQSGKVWNFDCPDTFFTSLREQIEKIDQSHSPEV